MSNVQLQNIISVGTCSVPWNDIKTIPTTTWFFGTTAEGDYAAINDIGDSKECKSKQEFISLIKWFESKGWFVRPHERIKPTYKEVVTMTKPGSILGTFRVFWSEKHGFIFKDYPIAAKLVQQYVDWRLDREWSTDLDIRDTCIA